MVSSVARLRAWPFVAYVAVDGAGWDLGLSPSVEPLEPRLLSLDPWPPLASGNSAAARLGWLASGFRERPLLGITHRPLVDQTNTSLRGASHFGDGLALVSLDGLSPEATAGVIRHEMAHAVGMDHCPSWECALSERPWPMRVEGRPSHLCPGCRSAWLERLVEAAP